MEDHKVPFAELRAAVADAANALVLAGKNDVAARLRIAMEDVRAEMQRRAAATASARTRE